MEYSKNAWAWVVFALLSAAQLPAYAQAAGGAFNQNATERKYLREQIAALKAYLNYARKGYGIVKDGTRLIGDIKDGDLNLHRKYLDDKKAVSAAVRGTARIRDIMALHEAMMQRRKTTLVKATGSGQFTARELSDMERLFKAIGQEADRSLDELLLVATDGKTSMSDDERIARIEKIYARMRQAYAIQQRLHTNILALAAGRERRRQELQILKELQ